MPPLIVITCGPASEPIDQVRRITNFSTGELGVRLAEAFAASGERVLCCKGEGATWPDPALPCETRHFFGNADLLTLLQEIREPVAAVFHAAALTDFHVAKVCNSTGQLLAQSKIPSTAEGLTIHLSPAPKVLPKLRSIFPDARLIGWKYELEGTKEEALEKGLQQIHTNHIDACVVNGHAYGNGFGLFTPEGIQHFSSKEALCLHLTSLNWGMAKKNR